MIVYRDEVPRLTVYTASAETIEGLMVCQKERLFVDHERVYRLLGPRVYRLFANFSDADILAALEEAKKSKSEDIVLCIELTPEAAAEAAKKIKP
jgi:hypothetical protein